MQTITFLLLKNKKDIESNICCYTLNNPSFRIRGPIKSNTEVKVHFLYMFLVQTIS